MLRWIVTQSLRFRFLVVALAGAMLFFGIGQLRDVPVDVFPEFAPPRVVIQTACVGLNTGEVESLVTIPLEQALNGMPGLDIMRSKSVSQLSSIELLFKQGTDLLHDRQLASERMSVVANQLPTWAAPPVMLPPLSATSRVMKVGLSSKTIPLTDLSMTAYWKIRARLLRVPGVANIAIWGERLKLLQVQVDPDKLAEHDVTLDKVMETTADSLDNGILKFAEGHFIGTGGFVETANQRLGIRHTLPIEGPDQLSKVVVKDENGKPLLLGDLGNVVFDQQPLTGDAIINDGPGLMMVIEKYPWGNTLQLTKDVEKALDEMRPGLPGVEINSSIFRPASFVDEAIHHLTTSLILGALLVILVLGLFLFDWRAALISVVTMPLSLVAAALVLRARGATINTMVLAGLVIALGAVVDDAIVDVENIVRRLRQNRLEGGTKSTAAVILEASIEVRGAVVYASFIEVVALLPVFFLNSLTGSIFKPLATTYALAVMVSLLVALISTPALSLILFSKGKVERHESPLARRLQRGYQKILTPIIRKPIPAYVALAALAVVGVAIVPRLGESLFPTFKERDFLMHWMTKPGTSLPEQDRITIRGSKELRSIPGVRNFGSHIGTAILGEEVAGVDFGENWISIDKSANYDETLAKVEAVAAGYPGMFTDVQTYYRERISEVLTGESEPLVVRIYGQNLHVLRDKAGEVKQMLASVKGIEHAHVELQVDNPQIQVEVDLAKAKQYGIKPGDVRRAAATIMAGEEVGDILTGGRAYDVQVWSLPKSRDSVTDVKELLLDTPSGDHVRLGDIADVRVAPVPSSIQHQDGLRRIDVGADVAGSDTGSVIRNVQEQLKSLKLPLEYHYTVEGVFKERQAAQSRLLGFAIIALTGIVFLCFAVFKNWRDVWLQLLTLPIALVGGLIGAYLTGSVLSIGSLVGFFTVIGITARNGIMEITHFQHLEREEGVPFGPELVLRGARERLAPILMTMLATGLALVPLVVTGDIAGQEIEYPMAAVILGGLVTSTLVNLFIVPSLYLRWGRPKAVRKAALAAS